MTELIDFSNARIILDIMEKYAYLFCEIGIKDQVLQTYYLAKPLVIIEIYELNRMKEIQEFVKEISRFFFTYSIDHKEDGYEIYLSRFASLINAIPSLHIEGYYDYKADLIGFLCGYSLSEIFNFCLKRELKLIK